MSRTNDNKRIVGIKNAINCGFNSTCFVILDLTFLVSAIGRFMITKVTFLSDYLKNYFSIRLSSKDEGNKFGINFAKIGSKIAPPGSMKIAKLGIDFKISSN